MGYSVKGGTEVKDEEDREYTRISHIEEVVGDLNQGCFSAVFPSEIRIGIAQRDSCQQGKSGVDMQLPPQESQLLYKPCT